MIDFFALLKEPKRPWLDEDALKGKFLQLSAMVHPDRVHEAADVEKQQANERYAELNSAYNCLREPKTRLQHLFELESGAKPKEVQQVPAETLELFMEVGQLCRQVDQFLLERTAVTSPLLKVQMFERAQEWIERLKAVQETLRAKRDFLREVLKAMNVAWETAPPTGTARLNALPMQHLEKVCREFSYLTRWGGQIQERIVQLSI